MPGRRGAAAPGRTLVPAISAVMLARRVAKGSSMGSGPRPPRCRPVPPPSPTAPGAYHLTGAPLDVTEWCASSALDVAEWHESRHMRSCQKILCHSMPPGGTPIAHSAPPSGTVGHCGPGTCNLAHPPLHTPESAKTPEAGRPNLRRRPLTSHERAGQLVASPPAHSWGHPIPATEWVCVTHVLWRRTHTSMHEVSKGYLK